MPISHGERAETRKLGDWMWACAGCSGNASEAYVAYRFTVLICSGSASTASPWWLLNGEPRPECATCPTVASTSNSASPWDVLYEAAHARCLCQVQPSVPEFAWGVGQSCEGDRQDGDAEFGIEVRVEVSFRRGPSASKPKSSPMTLFLKIKGYGVKLMLMAVLVASTASPWWLLNGEPRPQCATCPTVASTSNSASPWDVLY
jgi:hypothetical protein